MKLLEVVTLAFIYHDCSEGKMFWEENFTPMNMKICGRQNVRKHKEIKNGDQYIALDNYLDIGGLDNR